ERAKPSPARLIRRHRIRGQPAAAGVLIKIHAGIDLPVDRVGIESGELLSEATPGDQEPSKYSHSPIIDVANRRTYHQSQMHIDLNCDMGEVPEHIADGTQESLMRSITSVNIACGGHAGDERTMKTTIEQALRWNLTIGAHPGYPDRENFGRLEMDLPLAQIEETVFAQIRHLAEIAATYATAIGHVKPHGALYNQAVNKADLARAIANGVARFSKDVVLVGLAGSPMLNVFRDAGFRVAAEAFADRQYEPDGTLRSRKFDDALIRDPEKAAV